MVLPVGYYNVRTLLSALQALLVGWTVGYSTLTNTFTFTSPNDGLTYTMLFDTPSCELLGFRLGDRKEVTYAAPITSDIPVKVSRENVVLIHATFPKQKFSVIDNIQSSQMRESDILCKIPIDKPPFDNLTWRVNDLDINSFFLSAQQLSQVRIYLTDENNRPLPLPYDWTMTIRVDYFEGVDHVEGIQESVQRISDYLRLMVIDKMHPGSSDNNNKAEAKTKKISRYTTNKRR